MEEVSSALLYLKASALSEYLSSSFYFHLLFQGRKEGEVKVKDGPSDEVSRQIGEQPGK